MKKQPKIQAWERDKIAILLSSGTSVRSIARVLGRSHSSILSEIKRNSVGGEYYAIKANELSKVRNTASRQINPLKSPAVYSYVFDKLRAGWSPEEIAGRLRKEKGKTIICHETIYHYIHSPEGMKKRLYEYLVRKHKKKENGTVVTNTSGASKTRSASILEAD